MKVVVVSQRVDFYPERNERRDALDQDMIIWLLSAGYLPYPIPNALFTDTMIRDWLDVLQPAGIILSGGNDVGKERRRDFTEEELLRYAERKSLPLLAICRGMQMLARSCLVDLKSVNGHIGSRHELVGEITGEVNSYHQFSLTECPSGFRVLACSQDGEIEAIAHKTLPWEGWMWHPEREGHFHERDTQRLKGLLGD